MTLEQFLSEKRPAIVEKWFQLILATYPADTTNFLKTNKDPFRNPVGHTIFQGIEKILEELINGINIEQISPFLDNVLRVRAVQDLSPSQAVSFIFWYGKKSRKIKTLRRPLMNCANSIPA